MARLLGLALLLLGASARDGSAREHAVLTLPEAIRQRLGEAVLSGGIAWSPDGAWLAVPTSTGIFLHDARSGRLETHHDAGLARSVAFSPDSGTLAAGIGSEVRLWEVDTGQPRAGWDGQAFLRSVAFSPDGESLASGGTDHAIRLWEVETGRLQATLEGHAGEVESVAFSPDGRTVASGGGDYTVRLWDLETRRQTAVVQGHSGWIGSVAFSPDGGTVASGGWDGTVRLWDAATGQPGAILEGRGRHGAAGWVWSVAFLDEGTVVSGHDDGIRLWDVQTGRLESTLTLEGHTSWVSSVAFSPDGRSLASGSRSGGERRSAGRFYTVLPWDLRPRARVEARVTGPGAAGLTIDFSRSISGRRPHYAWSAVTDASGRLELTLYGGATGLYQARSLTAAGEAAASWYSLPVNSHRVESLDLTLAGSAAAGQASAGKAAASGEPAGSELYPNTPNPFNAGTQIAYRLAEAGPVRLRIYNLLGQPVRTLVDEVQAAGVHRLSWDGRDLRRAPVAAGIYVVRLDHPGGVHTRRLMCLK